MSSNAFPVIQASRILQNNPHAKGELETGMAVRHFRKKGSGRTLAVPKHHGPPTPPCSKACVMTFCILYLAYVYARGVALLAYERIPAGVQLLGPGRSQPVAHASASLDHGFKLFLRERCWRNTCDTQGMDPTIPWL